MYIYTYMYIRLIISICQYIYIYIYICVPASLCRAEIIADFFPQSFWTGTARTRSWTAAKRREAEATLQTVTFWNTQTHSVLVCGPVADMGVSENRVGYTKKVWPIREHAFFFKPVDLGVLCFQITCRVFVTEAVWARSHEKRGGLRFDAGWLAAAGGQFS